MGCVHKNLEPGRLLGCGEHELQGTAFRTLKNCIYLYISSARTRASVVLPRNPGSLIENGSEAHHPSYRMGSEDILPGVKPREADHSHLVQRL